MKYTIGFGLLIQDQTFFNSIRDLEISISELTNDTRNLQQPPHITVKRPFEVDDASQVKAIIASVRDWAASQPSTTIEWHGFGGFGNGVRFVAVNDSAELKHMHLTLCRLLVEKHGIKTDQLEGENAVFHTSIAIGMDASQAAKTDQFLTAVSVPDARLSLSTLGVFMKVSENGWAVVGHIPLNQAIRADVAAIQP